MLHVCRAPESLPARQCCSCFSGARRDDPFFIKPKAVLHPAVVAPTAVFFFFRSMQNSRPGGGNVEIFSGQCRTDYRGGGVVSKFFPVRAVRAELATGGGGRGEGDRTIYY